jgi:uncharacterized membrane protein
MSAPAVASAPSGSRTTTILLALVTVGAIFFWLVAAMPYATLDRQSFGPAPDVYWDRRYVLWLHILGGTVAMFIGPVQLWLGEMRRRLGLHRTLGIVYLAGAALTCGAGFYMSLTTPVGFVFGSGLFFLSVACTVATALAYLAIRRRNLLQHREWMIRSYVTIFAFVFFRAIVVALRGFGVGDPGLEGEILRASFAAWSCWAVPLLVTELFLQYPKIGRAV